MHPFKYLATLMRSTTSEDDMYFNAEMIQKIKASIKEVKNGEVEKISSSKEIDHLLGL